MRALAKTGLALLLAAATVSGCVQRPSHRTADEIARAAGPLMSLCGTEREIEASQWPEAFVRNHTRLVRLYRIGLYVETNRFYVDEAGVFLPCDAVSFAPDPNEWPKYTKVSNGVFTYYYSG